jgi:hypothetical protein
MIAPAVSKLSAAVPRLLQVRRSVLVVFTLAVLVGGATTGCGEGNSNPALETVTPGQVVQRFKRETGTPLQRAAVPDEAWEQLSLGLNASRAQIRRYGVFSVYVAKAGHTKSLDSFLRDKATKKALERDSSGVYWELDSNSGTWVAYKRYAGNVVLAWFSGSASKAADARWQRLDRVLGGLSG